MSISIAGRFAIILALLWSTDAAAQQLEVTGRVLDRQARGLAQARVELQVLHPVHELAELHLAGEPHPEIVARSRTDLDGELRLTVPAAGFWKVVVRHPEYLPASRDLSPLLDDLELADVVLPRRSELAARLVDGSGEPVAGVTLIVNGWSAEWKESAKGGWWPAERRVRTGPGGSGALPCAPGEKLSVAVLDGERFVYQEVDCDAGLLELRLEDGMRTARVVHSGGRRPGGAPAAGALAAGAHAFLLRPFLAFGASAEDGLIRGPFDFLSSVPVVFADSEAFYGKPLPSAPGGEGAEELPVLELPATVPLRGRLVDAFDRRPVAGAWLWVGRGSHHFQALADDGRFRLRRRVGEPAPLYFGASGYLPLVYDSAPAGTEELLARLTPAMTVRGRVVDPSGEGIAGASIRGRKPRLSSRHIELQAGGRWALGDIAEVADADGSFELRGLVPSASFLLRVVRSGFATRDFPVPRLEPGAPIEELVIVLEPGATGFGRVLNEREMPIGGAAVALLPALTGAAAGQDFGAGENFAATTDAEGGFTLRDLPLGTYYLSARSRGFPELLVPGIEISSSAEPIDLGTLILVPGVLLSGRVVDPKGEAVAGAQLSLRNADGEQIVVQRAESAWFASATSRQNGSFHLEGLPRHSRLTLLAVADGFLPREAAVTTGVEDQSLTLELSTGGRVSGVVLDARRRAAPDARVRVRPSPESPHVATSTSRSVTTDAEGRFEAVGLRPGEYDIEAMSGGAESDRVRRTVTAEGVADLYLQLRQKPSLVVSVLDAAGEPVSRAWLVAFREGPPPPDHERAGPRRAMSGGSGEAVLQLLEAGTHRVTAGHRDFEQVDAVVEVTGGSQQLELRFETRLEEETRYPVSGRVVDPAGLPVGGARVEMVGHSRSTGSRSSRFWPQPVTTRPDGRFELTAAAGEYRLWCRHEAYAALTGEPFTLGEGGVSDLIVELSPGATVIGRVTGLEAEDLSRLVVVARGPYEQRDGFEMFGQLYGAVNFAGELRIPGLSPGEWRVRAELLNPTRSAAERIEVEHGDGEVRVDLHFEQGYSVTGSVLRRGQPLAGATVILRCFGEFRGETFTDEAGRFTIEHVPAGRCTVRSADPESGLAGEQELEVAFDAEVVIELGL